MPAREIMGFTNEGEEPVLDRSLMTGGGRVAHPRRPARIAGVFCGTTISLLLTSTSAADPPGGAQTPKSASAPRSGDPAILELMAAATDEKEPEKKKRVPKPPDDEDEDDDEKKQKEDDDNSCLGEFTSCFISTLFSSDDDSPQETLAPEVTAPAPEERTHERRIETGTEVVIDPAPGVESVPVWSAPGGEMHGATLVYQLGRDTVALVVGTASVASTTWLSVNPRDADLTPGWILADHVLDTPDPEIALAPAPALTPAPSDELELQHDLIEPERPPLSRWQVTGDLGFFVADDPSSAISDEYRDGGFAAGVGIRFMPGASPHTLRLRYAFGHQGGDPQFNFITGDSARVDIPTDVDIYFHTLQLLAGTSHAVSDDGLLSWGIGPTISRVRERGSIDFEEYESGVLVNAGTEEQSLARWAFGAAVMFGYEANVAPTLSLGGMINATYAAWESRREESLGLDWLDDDGIFLVSITAVIGYGIR